MKFDYKQFLQKKENLYLTLALSLGLVMAVLNPPFDGVPDEHAHYWKAWAVAEGNFVCNPDNTIPESAKKLPGSIIKVKVSGDEKKVVFNGLLVKLLEKDSKEKATGGEAICGATPLGYIPQALGLKMGQLFNFSALGEFYIARIFNLILSVGIVYLAIRIIPFGKIILFIIGLLPMTLQQFSSLSYDALHIALVFLFIAYVIKIAHEKNKRLSTRDVFFLLLISLVGFNVKTGYVLLSLLVFVLPTSKFKNKKYYWFFMVGFLLVNIIFYLGITKLLSDGVQSAQVDSPINASKQLAYIASNPFNFLMVLFNQVYNSFNFYMETFLFKSGWLKKSISNLWYVFVIVGLVLFVKNENENVELTRKQRTIFLLVFLINFIATFIGLYLVWTKVGASKISGVQGRYFLGIFPLLILFFYKANFSLKFDFIKKNMHTLMVIFYMIVFFFVFQNIYKIYYDKTPKEDKIGILK